MITRTTTTSAYAWVILAVVYFASIAAPLNQYKTPPITPILMQNLHINLTQAGFLMSSIALTGFLLALPAGLILQRFGTKRSGLLALGFLITGGVMGAIAPTFFVLAISRIIEGIGAGLIGVIAPATLAQWFPPRQLGTAMGIWATWAPVGSIVMYNIAPALNSHFGWRSIWWFGVGYTILTALLYANFIRRPPEEKKEIKPSNPLSEMRSAFSQRGIWLLAITFACFNLVLVSLGTYYPTFLSTIHGYSLDKAGFYSSLATMLILFSAPFAGWLSDRIGSRRWFLAGPFLAIAVLLLFPFRVSGWQIILVMILQGLIAGAIPTMTFAATSEVVAKPEWAGLGLALILVGQNFGQLIGPIFFGDIAQYYGWIIAGYSLIPFCLVGFGCAWKLRLH